MDDSGWSTEGMDFRARLAALALAGVDTVAGPRNAEYGPPDVDMENLALAVTGYLRQRGLLTHDQRIEAFDMPIIFVLQKVMRLAHTPGHHDSIIDIIGWMLIDEECQQ